MAATIIPDTHRFVQRLVAAGMPTEQAEALKTELSDNVAELVTKQDLDLAASNLKLWLITSQLANTALILGVIAKAHGWL